jgi:hypothetical protein
MLHNPTQGRQAEQNGHTSESLLPLLRGAGPMALMLWLDGMLMLLMMMILMMTHQKAIT